MLLPSCGRLARERKRNKELQGLVTDRPKLAGSVRCAHEPVFARLDGLEKQDRRDSAASSMAVWASAISAPNCQNPWITPG